MHHPDSSPCNFFVQAHDVRPISVKSLKALGDRVIADQHFTCRDFANAVSKLFFFRCRVRACLR
jgi:hypothetical protein